VHPGVIDAYHASALPPRKLRRRYVGLSLSETRTLALLVKLHARKERTSAKSRTRRARRTTADAAVAATA
jgi:hypothetical protein